MYEEKHLETIFILKKTTDPTHEDFESTPEKETDKINNNSQLYSIPEDQKINILIIY